MLSEVARAGLDVSALERARLNRRNLDNKYWLLPVDDKGHENYSPVGRGRKSSDLCGKWLSLLTCKHTSLHKGVVKNGVDYTGKIVWKHNHLWCNKSSCPVCFANGWAARLARSIEGRLAEGTKRGFGKPEHIVVSVPVKDRDLPEEVLRDKVRKALFARGIVGGCMIFHGFRPNRKRGMLVWSTHHHVLGYILGGYGCRDCERKICSECNGFQTRTREENKKDGCIVRVLDERKTVYGTAWYQLHHATIRVGVKRFQVVTWFGVVSCNKLKAEKTKVEVPCPVCSSQMVKRTYVGKRDIVKDVGDPHYVAWGVDDESEESNYVDDASEEPDYDGSGGGRCL